ncbi:MAG: cytochrome c family protein [Rickettsiales bacterium]
MKDLELNKISAAILIAGIVALVAGNIADILYQPNQPIKQRGFSVEVDAGDAKADTEKVIEEKIDISALMKSANIESGKKEIKKCTVCHTFTNGGANRVGPNLWGIVGKEKGSHTGYKYSKAFEALTGKWTVDELFYYLQNPKKFAPGTKMAFAGIKKPQKTADVIKYLESLK